MLCGAPLRVAVRFWKQVGYLNYAKQHALQVVRSDGIHYSLTLVALDSV
jgi:hypothetical protein